MSTIKERDKEVIWHPYTPMKIWPEAIAIVKGEGATLTDEDGKEYIDAISSWWVNLHGHAHPYIAQKVSDQLSTLEHSIFAGFTHEPAVTLAERLIEILPSGIKKIFYSDNGSTAVEVAMKMSLQYWNNKGIDKKRFIAIENSYHGDTFGAMAVSARSIFTDPFSSLLFDVNFVPFPSKENEAESISVLEEMLSKGDVAALIVEPLIQGTAGMCMYSADALEAYFKLCKKYNTIIIADEVMTGFGRTGTLFACDQIQTSPDIVCLSKGLTGGTMPLGITATTQDIFDAFYDDNRLKTLYHGHSFTANPVACSASLASLDLLLKQECTDARKRIATRHAAFSDEVKDDKMVAVIRQLGTIIAIELNVEAPSYNHPQRDMIYRFFLERNVLMRPLGNIIYMLPPYCITDSQLNHIYTAIKELLVTLATQQ